MDVDNIAPGLDFVQVLNEQVARCDVLIAVIGKNWLGTADDPGSAGWTIRRTSSASKSSRRCRKRSA